jgi:hypothetical protein
MIPSMKNPLILTALFASLVITGLLADDKPLFAPRPTKDPIASKKHCQGAGIFQMAVDKPSGKVKAVLVGSSTNDVFLDAAVINTFLQWRFKLNTQSLVTIVVAFTADKDTAFYPVGSKIHPTNRGFGVPFDAPVRRRNYGNGFLSVMVLPAIDETLQVLRQNLGRYSDF